jgi:hypothetical protein
MRFGDGRDGLLIVRFDGMGWDGGRLEREGGERTGKGGEEW